jgi:hypothetical protein
VKFTTKEWEIDDKVVLEADIPRSKKYIHKAPDNDGEYKAYVRVDDQNLLANGVLLKVWQKSKKNQKIRFVYSKPVQEVLFYLREHPFILFEKAKEVSGLNKYKTEHLLSDLVLLEVIEQSITEDAVSYKLSTDIPEIDSSRTQ